MVLREDDVDSKKGLKTGTAGATKKLWLLRGADKAIRGLFRTYAQAVGLYGYHLPDMDEVAELAAPYYENNVRGGCAKHHYRQVA